MAATIAAAVEGVCAGPAAAAGVTVTQAPSVSGTARVGSTLSASGGKATGPSGICLLPGAARASACPGH